jgi:hypothetical protein
MGKILTDVEHLAEDFFPEPGNLFSFNITPTFQVQFARVCA